jgi:hypothetical protein
MKLRDKLIEETILVPIQATSKESANKELLTHLKSIDIRSSLYGSESRDEILNIFSQWEQDDNRKDDLV